MGDNRFIVLQVADVYDEDYIKMAIATWNQDNPGKPITYRTLYSAPFAGDLTRPTIYHSDDCRYVGERTQLGIRPLHCKCEGTTDPH